MRPPKNRQRSNPKKVLVRVAVLLATTLSGAMAHADDEAAMAEARRQFQAGVNLLDDPDGAKYEEAYHAFKKAYALSQSPRVLGNIGFCAFHLERDGEAIDAWSTYLRDGTDIEDAERAQIQKDLATLSSTVARVRITVKHPAKSFVLVDTRAQTRGPSVQNSYVFEGSEITVRVRPGRHAFKVKAGPVESTPFETILEPASSVERELGFSAPRPSSVVVVRESPSLAGPIMLAASGALGVGVGVATGLLARSKEAEMARSCTNDLCPATYDLDGQRDKAKAFATIADVSFAAGGALLGGALLWYVLLPRERAHRSTTAASAMCTGQGCAFQLQRGF